METTFGVRVAAALTGLGTLGIGIFPEPFLPIHTNMPREGKEKLKESSALVWALP
jgi:hypothetical protein